MPRIGFLMEQTLGHVTHSANLAAAVSHRPEIEPVWMPIVHESSGRLDKIPGIRSNWTLKGSVRARAALMDADPIHSSTLDALFIHTQTIAMFAHPWMKRIPTVISLDATPANFDTIGAAYGHRSGSWLTERFKQSCVRKTFASASRIICWSEWAAKSLTDDYGIHREVIHVVPPGVEIDRWKPPAGSRSWESSDPLRLLFVGGNFNRKGGPTLVCAFKEHLYPDFTLDIVTRDDIAATVEGVNGITVHSSLAENSEELLSLYHRAHVFVLPTHGDCLPIVLLEAMAAGLPIVTTPVGAIRQALPQEWDDCLVEIGNPGELAKAIRTVAQSPQRLAQRSAQCLKVAGERYNAETNYGMILAVITMLCA